MDVKHIGTEVHKSKTSNGHVVPAINGAARWMPWAIFHVVQINDKKTYTFAAYVRQHEETL